MLLPLVLPPVVGGLALLYLLGRKGFLGMLITTLTGEPVPFTTTAVVIAQTFVAMPFLVVSLEGALRGAGDRYEQVAATLGARPWTVFRRVTLPLLLPALGSGVVLSFARALGEFGATITFAGSLEDVTRTLPLEVYTQAEVDIDSAVALSLLLIVVAVDRHRRGAPALVGRRPAVSLTARIEAVRGSFSLDVDLDVPTGTVLALLGPNGSGKSTVLGCLAGLITPTSAEITVAGRALAGVAAAPAGDRPALPGRAALPAPVRGRTTSRSRRARPAPAAASRGSAPSTGWPKWTPSRSPTGGPGSCPAGRPSASRSPGRSPPSRTCCCSTSRSPRSTSTPRPRSAACCGASSRPGPTTVLVTHDPLDALALADHVAVMNGGRIVERGPTREVLSAPRTAFTARIAGLNLVAGTAVSGGLRTASGEVVSGIPAADVVLGEPAVAVFPPNAVAVYPHDGEHRGSPRNTPTPSSRPWNRTAR